MKIRMKIFQSGSPNGINVLPYYAGKEYDVPESLGKTFVSQGAAENLDDAPAAKMAQGPSENKDAAPARSRRV